MRYFRALALNSIFAIQLLLVFLLFFEEQVQLPVWLQVAGRMHPIVLHLPIGMLILLTILPLVRGTLPPFAYHQLQDLVAHLAALTASLTAIFGFFLAREGGYGLELLSWHKWTGVAVSFLAYGLLLLLRSGNTSPVLFNTGLAATMLLLIIAGHKGGQLTHGEDYLLAPLQRQEVVITEETPLFRAAVLPVLDRYCFSCHNERKTKGQLVLSTAEGRREGGDNGALWLPGDPESSLCLQRMRLPTDHEDHMPPEGKAQPAATEIALIEAWIRAGADEQRPLADFPAEGEARTLAAQLVATAGTTAVARSWDFEAASASVIERLNTPFRTVTPLATGSPALAAAIFVRETYQPDFLRELVAVKEQLVELNLSNLPIGDEELSTIASFQNLEKLILNGTDISGTGLSELGRCERLRSLGLSMTAVDASIGPALAGLPQLREVYIWQTRIDADGLERLENELPKLTFHQGFIPDPGERLPLSPPILENKKTMLLADDRIVLRHNLPGTEVRYTVDGSEPDSISSPLYQAPLRLEGYTILKAKAFREQWMSSETLTTFFFPRGVVPQHAQLLGSPDPQYPGEGAAGLTDGQKGQASNFRAPSWLGYREKPFAAVFDFGKTPPPISHVTLSYAQNMGAYIMPPVEVEVWGGNDPKNLQLLHRMRPPPPTGYEPNTVCGVEVPVNSGAYSFIKVIAEPVRTLPPWHAGKGDRGWLFVDEVLFY